jgi:hypothetical protein
MQLIERVGGTLRNHLHGAVGEVVRKAGEPKALRLDARAVPEKHPLDLADYAKATNYVIQCKDGPFELVRYRSHVGVLLDIGDRGSRMPLGLQGGEPGTRIFLCL